MQALLQLQGTCGMQVTLGQDLSEYFQFFFVICPFTDAPYSFFPSSVAGTICLSVATVPRNSFSPDSYDYEV
jgi:hypothetical protein